MSDEEREEGIAISHKLAGSLGMYGYQRGTEIASQLEQLLRSNPTSQPDHHPAHRRTPPIHLPHHTMTSAPVNGAHKLSSTRGCDPGLFFACSIAVACSPQPPQNTVISTEGGDLPP